MTSYPSIDGLLDKARAQVAALQGLAGQMESEAERMHRHDLAGQLRALAGAVAQEVKHVRETEEISAYRFTRGKLTNGAVSFGIGTLLGAIIGSREHPLRVGAGMAGDCLSKTSPFGTVLVAVATESTGEDWVKVIELSKMARESGWTEAQVRTNIQRQGRILVTPEEFAERMEEKVHEVLQRKLDLSPRKSLLLPPAAANVKLLGTGNSSKSVSQGDAPIP